MMFVCSIVDSTVRHTALHTKVIFKKAKKTEMEDFFKNVTAKENK